MSALIFSAEDTWRNVIKPRLLAARADLSRVLYVEMPADESGEAAALELPTEIKHLEELTVARGDVSLVIFDPLVAFIGDDTDTHKDHSTRAALKPLSDFAARTGTAVIGVMHLNKSAGTSLYQRLSMSSAFYNAVRTAALFASDPEAPDTDYRILAQDKNNLAKEAQATRWLIEGLTVEENGIAVETSRLTYSGITELSAHQLLDGGHRDSAPKAELAAEKLQQWWLEAAGPLPATVIEEKIAVFNNAQPSAEDRISQRTFSNAMSKLGGESRKSSGFGSGGHWEWVPPEGYFDEIETARTEATPGEER